MKKLTNTLLTALTFVFTLGVLRLAHDLFFPGHTSTLDYLAVEYLLTMGLTGVMAATVLSLLMLSREAAEWLTRTAQAFSKH